MTNFEILLDGPAAAGNIWDHLRTFCDRSLQQFGVRELGNDMDDIVEEGNDELLQRL